MTHIGNKSGFLSCFALAAAAAMAFGAPAYSAPDGEAVLLVAKREFLNPLYGGSIVLAKPIGNGQHMGFIINKPTSIALRDALPQDQLSPRLDEPLYLGGPFNLRIVFAFVHQPDSPGRGSVEFADNLHVTIDRNAVKSIAAVKPDQVRFFLGTVLWRPGELDAEMERGLWHSRVPDVGVVLRKDTTGLWEELVRRSEQEAYFGTHGI